MTKLKNSNFHKTQKLKFGQNSKTQIVTKLKNSNCDKTQSLQFDKTKIVKRKTKQDQIVIQPF